VKTEVVLYPIAVYYNRQTDHKEYSVFLGSHNESTGEPSAQLDHVIHTTWPSTAYCCIPRGYSNPRIDDIIERGNATMDPRARELLYQQAIEAAVNDVALIFLHLQVNNWGLRPGLTYQNRMDEMTMAEDVIPTN
jgi:peptide/nickel transport system substrate-binding protein